MIKYEKLILFLGLIFLISCSSEDVNQQIIVGDVKNTVSFKSALSTVNHGETITVELNLAKETVEGGYIDIAFSSENAIYSDDFITTPVSTNSIFRLEIGPGIKSISFDFISRSDEAAGQQKVVFKVAGVSESLDYNSNERLVINIGLADVTADETLTVVTWNIKFFPINGNTTINAVKDIILNMDADIIAMQEIDDMASFTALDEALTEWEGALYDVHGGLELGYLYKTSEITSFSNLSVIYNHDRNAFPRQPVVATASHKNKLEVTLINLHLKCCNDGEVRRGTASTLLKSYIDENLATDNVIVLGDFNDDLKSGSPFSNFISDTDNYYFADIDIANGSSANWSYPSYPSHIDHILITNELVDNLIFAETLKLNIEVSGYTNNVSDHLPVSASFTN